MICVRCRKEIDAGKACHCLCVEHDPGKQWVWCSPFCRRYSHAKPKEKEKEVIT